MSLTLHSIHNEKDASANYADDHKPHNEQSKLVC